MIRVGLFAAAVIVGLVLIVRSVSVADDRDGYAALLCFAGLSLILCTGLVAL